jgi:hypothetical protein
MKRHAPLAEALIQMVSNHRGLVLLLGAEPLVQELGTKLPGCLVIQELIKPKKLHHKEASPLVISASWRALPIAKRAVTAIVSINALSRCSTPAAVLASWSTLLRPGGKVILVEPLVQSRIIQLLRRVIEPSRFLLPPERLTSLLLNAGYSAIRQFWPIETMPATITTALLKYTF